MSNETLEEAAENYGWRIKRNTFSDAVKANELAESAQQDFIAGAKWQQETSQQIIPFDAYNIEVFAIKPDENGKLFAYIGYKITNGNFHFNVVPFTEPQQERSYSEEDLDAFRKFMIQEQNFSKSCLDVFVEQFKK